MSAVIAKLRAQIIVAHDREETMRGATGEDMVTRTMLAMKRADQLQTSRGWPKTLPEPKEHWSVKAKRRAAYKFWTLAWRSLDRVERLAFTLSRKVEDIAVVLSGMGTKALRRRRLP